MRVEALALFRSIGSFDAIAVELTGGNASYPNMPDVTGPVTHRIEINDPGGGRVIRVLIELKAHPGGVTAEQGKIDALSVLVCAPRQWIPRLNFTVLRRSSKAVPRTLLYRQFSHR